MIAYLEGKVVLSSLEGLIVEVNGVGYGVAVSPAEQPLIKTGEITKLYIYEHIKEDLHDLYGFLNISSRDLFVQLLSVKNVGPKVALAVMGLGNEGSVRLAIASGDVKTLQSAKGVGKRAAEQMVVELRDKVGLVSGVEAEQIVGRGGVDNTDEAVDALVALGFSDIDAQKALSGIDKDLLTEERVKLALKEKR